MNSSNTTKNHRSGLVATLILVLLLSARATWAADFTVSNNAGSGPGSLHQAVLSANANAGADSISFSVVGTITLEDELFITDDLTIRGPGAGDLTISGGGTRRVIFNHHAIITIDGLTLANGYALAGAAVYNEGGDWGPGDSGRAILFISNSVLTGNRTWGSYGGGGAIVNNAGPGGSAELVITNSTLSDNWAGYGGAIYNNAFNDRGNAILTITNSTLTRNSAEFSGGGITNDGGDGHAELTITNSTLSGNRTTRVSEGGGGGIANFTYDNGTAEVLIANSTLIGNAGRAGGGVLNVNSGPAGSAEVHTTHTLFANGAGGGNYSDLAAAGSSLTSLGHNIADDGSLSLNNTGDQNNIADLNLYLGPLADNGGPTQTHALLNLPGNPALHGGAPDFDSSALPLDQRGTGFWRIVGPAIDVGAFELQTVPSPEEETEALLDLVQSMEIQDGIQNALTVKLNGALLALESGNTAEACQNLQDFINLSQAQSGRKLTAEDAADLLTQAAAVREQLDCP